MRLEPLPIDDALPDIRSALDRARAVIVVAAPGAGKTTRVPPALAPDGSLILLQPRRAAARSIAQRIAAEQGWTLGEEVGWHVRFDRRLTARTRLIVATEGILTARLQADPLLSDFTTVVLDEFHERSIHADLGLALVKQAWRARDDLRVVVMSATLDARPVAAFLGDAPVVVVPGTLHPVDVEYVPNQPVERAALDLLVRADGDVLCFLPGAREIANAADRIRSLIGARADVSILHGGLDGAEQDRIIRAGGDGGKRRVIVSTNLAETSVTVGGVRAVVDSGLHKVARYDPARGVDSLLTERISADAAEQRAGRAGRLGPGLVRRLWAQADRLRPHREPEIHRVDLSAVVLDIAAWGGDLGSFEWFEAPDPEALDAAIRLLDRLGALHLGVITDLGRQMQRLPVHPRVARILLAGNANRSLIRACVLIAERAYLPPRVANTSSDLLSVIDGWADLPEHLHRAATELTRSLQGAGGDLNVSANGDHDTLFRRALLAGYPDRVAQRRSGSVDARFKLSSGGGAVLSKDSGVRDAEYLIAIDLRDTARADAIIHVASRIEREWLEPTSRETRHRLEDTGRVRAFDALRYEELTLAERAAPPDPDVAAHLLATAWLAGTPSAETTLLLRRLAFAGCEIDLETLAAAAAYGVDSVGRISIEPHLDRETRRRLETGAPETLVVPSGRSVRLEYLEDGSVSASVKLQELFGLPETPRIGVRAEPVLFELLAPNGRPIQRTRDLRSFWDRTYPEVRKELRGRYPKHPWPEDPWTATPTARARPRR